MYILTGPSNQMFASSKCLSSVYCNQPVTKETFALCNNAFQFQ